MNDEEIESTLNQLAPSAPPLALRARVLEAMRQQASRGRPQKTRWIRLASLAALLVLMIALNFFCAAYDRTILTEVFGGPRLPHSVRMLQEDVEWIAPQASTDWVQPYLERFGNLEMRTS